jgi:hypothetical protein
MSSASRLQFDDAATTVLRASAFVHCVLNDGINFGLPKNQLVRSHARPWNGNATSAMSALGQKRTSVGSGASPGAQYRRRTLANFGSVALAN